MPEIPEWVKIAWFVAAGLLVLGYGLQFAAWVIERTLAKPTVRPRQELDIDRPRAEWRQQLVDELNTYDRYGRRLNARVRPRADTYRRHRFGGVRFKGSYYESRFN